MLMFKINVLLCFIIKYGNRVCGQEVATGVVTVKNIKYSIYDVDNGVE